ncbi:MAG: protease modulator HflC [Burkholderia sp.]|nr:protease modulator HflC [Burkholderia sp.]
MNRIIELILMIMISTFIASSTLLNIDPRYSAVLSGGFTTVQKLVCPGIHFRLPLPMQSVTLVDMRLQSLDINNPFQILTSDKNQLLITYTIVYRVSDAIKYVSEITRRRSPRFVVDKLSTAAKCFLTDAFSRRSLKSILSDQHALTNEVRDALWNVATGFGIDLIDIRLTSIDLPVTQMDNIYQRMRDEIDKNATQIRLDGDVEVQKIIACADHNRQKVLANSYERAQRIKGEGDAKAVSITADVFNQDPNFYQLYASLQAYKNIFKDNDIIVVSPDSEFFKFMHSSVGKTIKK